MEWLIFIYPWKKMKDKIEYQGEKLQPAYAMAPIGKSAIPCFAPGYTECGRVNDLAFPAKIPSGLVLSDNHPNVADELQVYP